MRDHFTAYERHYPGAIAWRRSSVAQRWEAAQEGLYICDTTTSLPEHSLHHRQGDCNYTALKEHGIHYLDSAVSGTSVMAQAGVDRFHRDFWRR